MKLKVTPAANIEFKKKGWEPLLEINTPVKILERYSSPPGTQPTA